MVEEAAVVVVVYRLPGGKKKSGQTQRCSTNHRTKYMRVQHNVVDGSRMRCVSRHAVLRITSAAQVNSSAKTDRHNLTNKTVDGTVPKLVLHCTM